MPCRELRFKLGNKQIILEKMFSMPALSKEEGRQKVRGIPQGVQDGLQGSKWNELYINKPEKEEERKEEDLKMHNKKGMMRRGKIPFILPLFQILSLI